MKSNKGEIDAWLNGAKQGQEKKFIYSFHENTGRLLKEGESLSKFVKGVRVVLQKDLKAPGGYNIKTSFPVE